MGLCGQVRRLCSGDSWQDGGRGGMEGGQTTKEGESSGCSGSCSTCPSYFPSCVPGRSEKESVSVKCCLPCMPSWSTKRGRSKFLIPSCTRLTTHATVLVFSHSGAPTRAGGARQPSLEGTILLAQTALPAELRRLQHIKGGGGWDRPPLPNFPRGWP